MVAFHKMPETLSLLDKFQIYYYGKACEIKENKCIVEL